MTKENITTGLNISRERMIQLLNEDLAGEYQAIIAYTVYSQVLKGAAYTDIARELESHAGEELAHAIKIAKQIDYLGGMPGVSETLRAIIVQEQEHEIDLSAALDINVPVPKKPSDRKTAETK